MKLKIRKPIQVRISRPEPINVLHLGRIRRRVVKQPISPHFVSFEQSANFLVLLVNQLHNHTPGEDVERAGGVGVGEEEQREDQGQNEQIDHSDHDAQSDVSGELSARLVRLLAHLLDLGEVHVDVEVVQHHTVSEVEAGALDAEFEDSGELSDEGDVEVAVELDFLADILEIHDSGVDQRSARPDLFEREEDVEHVQAVKKLREGVIQVRSALFDVVNKIDRELGFAADELAEARFGVEVRVAVRADPEKDQPVDIEEDGEEVEVLVEEGVGDVRVLHFDLRGLYEDHQGLDFEDCLPEEGDWPLGFGVVVPEVVLGEDLLGD